MAGEDVGGEDMNPVHPEYKTHVYKLLIEQIKERQPFCMSRNSSYNLQSLEFQSKNLHLIIFLIRNAHSPTSPPIKNAQRYCYFNPLS